MAKNKGIGALVAGGVVGIVAWAISRQAQEQEQTTTVYYQKQPSTTDTKQALIGAVLGALGGAFEVGGTAAMQEQTTSRGKVSSGGGTSNDSGTQNLLDMIARYEGGVNGYDVVYGGSRIQTPKPLTQMTVQEVRNWQDQSVRAGSASSAVGKYQIIRGTMDQLISAGVLRRSELFNVAAQERAGRYLLERRGLSSYQSGQISETQFAQNLSKEWASLPATVTDRNGRQAQGQSYYAGDGLNSAHYTIADLMNAVRGIA